MSLNPQLRKAPHNVKGRAQKPAKHKESGDAEVELSEELKEELKARNEYVDDPHAASASKHEVVEEPKEARGILSKRQEKKLKKVLEIKEKKARRQSVLESLSKHALDPKRASLITRTISISAQRQTTKEKLREQLKMERAGLSELFPVDASERVRLTVSKEVEEMDEASDSESSSSGSDEEEKEEEEEAMPPMDEKAKEAEEAPKPENKPKITNIYGIPDHILEQILQQRKDTRPSAQDLMRKAAQAGMSGLTHVARVLVPVNRTQQVQEQRMKLPIIREEFQIMEAIKEHPVIVLCGETGSGKTTQVPQFLYEAGYTLPGPEESSRMMIGVTEPRRIAAINMAKRVATELNLSLDKVSYHVRYENSVTDRTEIKFMTDGVLQKEIETDFALRRYSCIVVDEAHERSMHTDILLGLLSRIVPLRQRMHDDSKKNLKPGELPLPPLKLIIMSATLRVNDFVENPRLFPNMKIPVISVDARQYPVSVHFSKRTRVDVDPTHEAFKKVSQIHRRLPQGGILVFLTGQNEIYDLMAKLKKRFPMPKDAAAHGGSGGEPARKKGRRDAKEAASVAKGKGERGDAESKTSGVPASAVPYPVDEEIDGELSDEEGEEGEDDGAEGLFVDEEIEDESAQSGPLYVLPLYSNLASKKQAQIFEAVPEGARLCVVATNVAETSLTIPGIRYVVDAGLVKNLHHDKVTGVSSFEVEWTSKASATQRAGRAGRTGPGHAYRLYSSAVYEHEFPQFSDPEIVRLPADGLMLQMKAMNIDRVMKFPFPTPPSDEAMQAAERLLIHLNAIDKDEKKITPLGRVMATYPVSPRFAKMLALAQHYNCLPHVNCIVAALTVRDVFVMDAAALDGEEDGEEDGEDKEDKRSDSRKAGLAAARKQWKLQGIAGGGDLASILSAVGACDYELGHGGDLSAFCEKMMIREKAITEIRKLRKQLAQKAKSVLDAEDADDTGPDGKAEDALSMLAPPTPEQQDAIRQIFLAGFGDRVARLSDKAPVGAVQGTPLVPYMCNDVEDPVYMHPTSALHGQKPAFVVYHELFRGKKRIYMKVVTVVQVDWLSRLVPNLCSFSKPLENPSPAYDDKKDDVRCHMTAVYGAKNWEIPALELSYPMGPDRFKYFARFLLEGLVFPKLAKFTPTLKNKPAILNRPWVKDRIVAILQPLVNEKIDSRAKLIAKWKTDPKFLMQAYSMWLDPAQHSELVAMWPPIEAKDSK